MRCLSIALIQVNQSLTVDTARKLSLKYARE